MRGRETERQGDRQGDRGTSSRTYTMANMGYQVRDMGYQVRGHGDQVRGQGQHGLAGEGTGPTWASR